MPAPLRVLVVEDSNPDTLLLVRELGRSGREIVWERVETAEQMLSALESGPWDLVVSDYSLPRFSAPKALELFKETGLDLPFIVVSGKVGEDVAVETMKAGAHDFLLKGSFTRLVPAVNRELEQAAWRRAGRRAEEASAWFAAIVESSIDAIIGRTLEGTVTAWNAGAEKLLGYSAEEVIGQQMTLHVPVERAGQVERNLERIQRGEVIKNFETVLIRKDGTRVDVSLTISPVRSSSGEITGASTIAHDITQRKRAEKEIRKSEERFRRLFDANIIGINIVDVQGRILEANDTFLSMIGYTREDLLSGGLRWDEMTPAEHSEKDRIAVEQLRRTGTSRPWEKDLLRKDGTRVPVLIGVAMLAESDGSCIACVVDLSARR